MDCGEKVVSVIYTDDGLYLGKLKPEINILQNYLTIRMYQVTILDFIYFSSAGGLMNGQIRLFNAANGNHITYLQTPEIEQDR